MPTLPEVQNGSKQLTYGSTPEEIQAYIDIVTEFLADTLNRRGSSIEEWNKFRKETVASEVDFIDSELERLEGPTDPLPPIAP